MLPTCRALRHAQALWLVRPLEWPRASRALTTSLVPLQHQAQQGDRPSNPRNPWSIALASLAVSAALGLGLPPGWSQCEASDAADAPAEYTPEEVAQHNTAENGIWVTFKGHVYDITEFVELHPGGMSKIMLAAGGPLEPFWSVYQQHQKGEVQEILQEYRIGKLKGESKIKSFVDPYASEPKRHSALIVRSAKPYNGETPGELLAAGIITPNELFYIRNHLPAPEVDLSTYQLKIEGVGVRPLTYSLEELKANFKKYTVTATLQCAGNRRHELKEVKEVKGLDWDVGAIGTATWGGVRLRDVLKAAGLEDDDPAVAHVQFEGLDSDVDGGVYGASVPVDVALSPRGDVLLAWEMNGQPLSRDHGAPLRVVVPGVTGARHVKWLGRVITSSEESASHWQRRDYKSFSPSTDWDNVDWDSSPAIQDPPVTSAICEPRPGDSLAPGQQAVKVSGYAWSGGGRGIVRVDVSADGGDSWIVAQLQPLPGQHAPRAWAWTQWTADVPLPAGGGKVELVCKAVDSSYNTQPDSTRGVWNLRGVVNNAWHRVQINRPAPAAHAA